MFAYKKCLPHPVLPRVEVCPEAARTEAQVTELVHREFVRIEQVGPLTTYDLGAESILALL